MIEKFATTGIGSMPHRDAEEACRIILDKVDIPFWPQLPAISFRELMIPQYSEGMPGIKILPEGQKMWIDSGAQDQINAFYENYSEESELEISKQYAQGFYTFAGKIQGRRFSMLKGHVTGPLTFTLGLKDEKGIPVYFNEELREISLMVLKGKIRWQMRKLTEFSDRVMIFIDEPILSAIGTSSYVGVSEDEVNRLLSEVVREIRRWDGISAIHCCGKADWKLVMESGIDVVNFDAFDYFENFRIYTNAVKEFLNRGGYIASGIVPTSAVISDVTPEVLKQKFENQLAELSGAIGFAQLTGRMLLTPSCGTGSLKIDEAEKVFDTLHSLKQALL